MMPLKITQKIFRSIRTFLTGHLWIATSFVEIKPDLFTMSRGPLSFSSVGQKAEYRSTMYFGLYHCSQLPN